MFGRRKTDYPKPPFGTHIRINKADEFVLPKHRGIGTVKIPVAGARIEIVGASTTGGGKMTLIFTGVNGEVAHKAVDDGLIARSAATWVAEFNVWSRQATQGVDT